MIGQSYDFNQLVRAIQVELSDGRFENALAYSSEAILMEVTQPEGYIYSAMAYYKLDQLDKAAEYAEDALNFSNAGQEKFIQQIINSIADKRKFNGLVSKAKLSLRNGNRSEAAMTYHEAWKIIPIRTDVALQAVNMYIDLITYEPAMEILQELAKMPDAILAKQSVKMYQALKNSKVITDKENFTKYSSIGDNYFQGRDFKNALKYYQEAKKYKANSEELSTKIYQTEDEIAFQNAIKDEGVDWSEIYIRNFPNGKYADKINNSLQAKYVGFGKKHYFDQNYNKAQDYFSKYKNSFAYGSKIEYVDKMLKKTSRKIHKLGLDDRTFLQLGVNTPFLEFSTDSILSYGIMVGKLWQQGVGMYGALYANKAFFTRQNNFTVDDELIRDVTNVGDYAYTGKTQIGQLDFTLGITGKLFNPIWLYVGGGFNYSPFFNEFSNINNGNDEQTIWARNTDQTSLSFFADAGLIFDFGGFNLRYGVRSGSDLQSIATQSVGIGFSVPFDVYDIYHDDRLYYSFIVSNPHNAKPDEDLVSYGLSIGKLRQDRIGMYGTLGGHHHIGTETSYYTIDDEGNRESTVDNDTPPGVFEETGNVRNGQIHLSLGMTGKVFHTMWLYLGGGLSYKTQYVEGDLYLSGDYDRTDWARNTDQTSFDGMLDAGIILDFKGFNLRYGLNTSDFRKIDRQSFGVGFSLPR